MLKPVSSALFLVSFVCICRVVPHLANFSPIIFMSLFMTRFFSRSLSCIVTMIAMLVSDMMLSMHSPYRAFGSWTWFTYSALLAIIGFGSLVDRLEERFALSSLLTLGASFLFWSWTNFGVWLFSGLYLKNMSGFTECYIAAIPFLQHSLMSAYLWLVVFFGYRRINVANKYIFQTQ